MPFPKDQPVLSISELNATTPVFTQLSNGRIRQILLQTLTQYFGASQYEVIDEGLFRAYGVPSEVEWQLNSGSGLLTIDSIMSIKTAMLVVDPSVNGDGSNNFTLTIEDESGDHNNWDPSSQALTEVDLWIPAVHVYDIGAIDVDIALAKQVSHMPKGSNGVIAPDITWGNGRVNFDFNGSSDFGSKSKVLITIQP